MKINHVTGVDKGSIILYGLSTCVWCKKAKGFLDQLGVQYDFVDVDLLEKDDRNKATETVKKLNPRCTFPTLSIKGTCVVGFDEEKIRGALES